MSILIGIFAYVGLVALALTFFRFVHRSDDVLRAIHADLQVQEHQLETRMVHNRVA
ncbi:MAG: hypothetical protein WB699_08615 [Bacteroidota bacterium]